MEGSSPPSLWCSSLRPCSTLSSAHTRRSYRSSADSSPPGREKGGRNASLTYRTHRRVIDYSSDSSDSENSCRSDSESCTESGSRPSQESGHSVQQNGERVRCTTDPSGRLGALDVPAVAAGFPAHVATEGECTAASHYTRRPVAGKPQVPVRRSTFHRKQKKQQALGQPQYGPCHEQHQQQHVLYSALDEEQHQHFLRFPQQEQLQQDQQQHRFQPQPEQNSPQRQVLVGAQHQQHTYRQWKLHVGQEQQQEQPFERSNRCTDGNESPPAEEVNADLTWSSAYSSSVLHRTPLEQHRLRRLQQKRRLLPPPQNVDVPISYGDSDKRSRSYSRTIEQTNTDSSSDSTCSSTTAGGRIHERGCNRKSKNLQVTQGCPEAPAQPFHQGISCTSWFSREVTRACAVPSALRLAPSERAALVSHIHSSSSLPTKGFPSWPQDFHASGPIKPHCLRRRRPPAAGCTHETAPQRRERASTSSRGVSSEEEDPDLASDGSSTSSYSSRASSSSESGHSSSRARSESSDIRRSRTKENEEAGEAVTHARQSGVQLSTQKLRKGTYHHAPYVDPTAVARAHQGLHKEEHHAWKEQCQQQQRRSRPHRSNASLQAEGSAAAAAVAGGKIFKNTAAHEDCLSRIQQDGPQALRHLLSAQKEAGEAERQHPQGDIHTYASSLPAPVAGSAGVRLLARFLHNSMEHFPVHHPNRAKRSTCHSSTTLTGLVSQCSMPATTAPALAETAPVHSSFSADVLFAGQCMPEASQQPSRKKSVPVVGGSAHVRTTDGHAPEGCAKAATTASLHVRGASETHSSAAAAVSSAQEVGVKNVEGAHASYPLEPQVSPAVQSEGSSDCGAAPTTAAPTTKETTVICLRCHQKVGCSCCCFSSSEHASPLQYSRLAFTENYVYIHPTAPNANKTTEARLVGQGSSSATRGEGTEAQNSASAGVRFAYAALPTFPTCLVSTLHPKVTGCHSFSFHCSEKTAGGRVAAHLPLVLRRRVYVHLVADGDSNGSLSDVGGDRKSLGGQPGRCQLSDTSLLPVAGARTADTPSGVPQHVVLRTWRVTAAAVGLNWWRCVTSGSRRTQGSNINAENSRSGSRSSSISSSSTASEGHTAQTARGGERRSRQRLGFHGDNRLVRVQRQCVRRGTADTLDASGGMYGGFKQLLNSLIDWVLRDRLNATLLLFGAESLCGPAPGAVAGQQLLVETDPAAAPASAWFSVSQCGAAAKAAQSAAFPRAESTVEKSLCSFSPFTSNRCRSRSPDDACCSNSIGSTAGRRGSFAAEGQQENGSWGSRSSLRNTTGTVELILHALLTWQAAAAAGCRSVGFSSEENAVTEDENDEENRRYLLGCSAFVVSQHGVADLLSPLKVTPLSSSVTSAGVFKKSEAVASSDADAKQSHREAERGIRYQSCSCFACFAGLRSSRFSSFMETSTLAMTGDNSTRCSELEAGYTGALSEHPLRRTYASEGSRLTTVLLSSPAAVTAMLQQSERSLCALKQHVEQQQQMQQMQQSQLNTTTEKQQLFSLDSVDQKKYPPDTGGKVVERRRGQKGFEQEGLAKPVHAEDIICVRVQVLCCSSNTAPRVTDAPSAPTGEGAEASTGDSSYSTLSLLHIVGDATMLCTQSPVNSNAVNDLHPSYGTSRNSPAETNRGGTVTASAAATDTPAARGAGAAVALPLCSTSTFTSTLTNALHTLLQRGVESLTPAPAASVPSCTTSGPSSGGHHVYVHSIGCRQCRQGSLQVVNAGLCQSGEKTRGRNSSTHLTAKGVDPTVSREDDVSNCKSFSNSSLRDSHCSATYAGQLCSFPSNPAPSPTPNSSSSLVRPLSLHEQLLQGVLCCQSKTFTLCSLPQKADASTSDAAAQLLDLLQRLSLHSIRCQPLVLQSVFPHNFQETLHPSSQQLLTYSGKQKCATVSPEKCGEALALLKHAAAAGWLMLLLASLQRNSPQRGSEPESQASQHQRQAQEYTHLKQQQQSASELCPSGRKRRGFKGDHRTDNDCTRSGGTHWPAYQGESDRMCTPPQESQMQQSEQSLNLRKRNLFREDYCHEQIPRSLGGSTIVSHTDSPQAPKQQLQPSRGERGAAEQTRAILTGVTEGASMACAYAHSTPVVTIEECRTPAFDAEVGVRAHCRADSCAIDGGIACKAVTTSSHKAAAAERNCLAGAAGGDPLIISSKERLHSGLNTPFKAESDGRAAENYEGGRRSNSSRYPRRTDRPSRYLTRYSTSPSSQRWSSSPSSDSSRSSLSESQSDKMPLRRPPKEHGKEHQPLQIAVPENSEQLQQNDQQLQSHMPRHHGQRYVQQAKEDAMNTSEVDTAASLSPSSSSDTSSACSDAFGCCCARCSNSTAGTTGRGCRRGNSKVKASQKERQSSQHKQRVSHNVHDTQPNQNNFCDFPLSRRRKKEMLQRSAESSPNKRTVTFDEPPTSWCPDEQQRQRRRDQDLLMQRQRFQRGQEEEEQPMQLSGQEQQQPQLHGKIEGQHKCRGNTQRASESVGKHVYDGNQNDKHGGMRRERRRGNMKEQDVQPQQFAPASQLKTCLQKVQSQLNRSINNSSDTLERGRREEERCPSGDHTRKRQGGKDTQYITASSMVQQRGDSHGRKQRRQVSQLLLEQCERHQLSPSSQSALHDQQHPSMVRQRKKSHQLVCPPRVRRQQKQQKQERMYHSQNVSQEETLAPSSEALSNSGERVRATKCSSTGCTENERKPKAAPAQKEANECLGDTVSPSREAIGVPVGNTTNSGRHRRPSSCSSGGRTSHDAVRTNRGSRDCEPHDHINEELERRKVAKNEPSGKKPSAVACISPVPPVEYSQVQGCTAAATKRTNYDVDSKRGIANHREEATSAKAANIAASNPMSTATNDAAPPALVSCEKDRVPHTTTATCKDGYVAASSTSVCNVSSSATSLITTNKSNTAGTSAAEDARERSTASKHAAVDVVARLAGGRGANAAASAAVSRAASLAAVRAPTAAWKKPGNLSTCSRARMTLATTVPVLTAAGRTANASAVKKPLQRSRPPAISVSPRYTPRSRDRRPIAHSHLLQKTQQQQLQSSQQQHQQSIQQPPRNNQHSHRSQQSQSSSQPQLQSILQKPTLQKQAGDFHQRGRTQQPRNSDDPRKHVLPSCVGRTPTAATAACRQPYDDCVPRDETPPFADALPSHPVVDSDATSATTTGGVTLQKGDSAAAGPKAAGPTTRPTGSGMSVLEPSFLPGDAGLSVREVPHAMETETLKRSAASIDDAAVHHPTVPSTGHTTEETREKEELLLQGLREKDLQLEILHLRSLLRKVLLWKGASLNSGCATLKRKLESEGFLAQACAASLEPELAGGATPPAVAAPRRRRSVSSITRSSAAPVETAIGPGVQQAMACSAPEVCTEHVRSECSATGPRLLQQPLALERRLVKETRIPTESAAYEAAVDGPTPSKIPHFAHTGRYRGRVEWQQDVAAGSQGRRGSCMSSATVILRRYPNAAARAFRHHSPPCKAASSLYGSHRTTPAVAVALSSRTAATRRAVPTIAALLGKRAGASRGGRRWSMPTPVHVTLRVSTASDGSPQTVTATERRYVHHTTANSVDWARTAASGGHMAGSGSRGIRRNCSNRPAVAPGKGGGSLTPVGAFKSTRPGLRTASLPHRRGSRPLEYRRNLSPATAHPAVYCNTDAGGCRRRMRGHRRDRSLVSSCSSRRMHSRQMEFQAALMRLGLRRVPTQGKRGRTTASIASGTPRSIAEDSVRQCPTTECTYTARWLATEALRAGRGRSPASRKQHLPRVNLHSRSNSNTGRKSSRAPHRDGGAFRSPLRSSSRSRMQPCSRQTSKRRCSRHSSSGRGRRSDESRSQSNCSRCFRHHSRFNSSCSRLNSNNSRHNNTSPTHIAQCRRHASPPHADYSFALACGSAAEEGGRAVAVVPTGRIAGRQPVKRITSRKKTNQKSSKATAATRHESRGECTRGKVTTEISPMHASGSSQLREEAIDADVATGRSGSRDRGACIRRRNKNADPSSSRSPSAAVSGGVSATATRTTTQRSNTARSDRVPAFEASRKRPLILQARKMTLPPGWQEHQQMKPMAAATGYQSFREKVLSPSAASPCFTGRCKDGSTVCQLSQPQHQPPGSTNTRSACSAAKRRSPGLTGNSSCEQRIRSRSRTGSAAVKGVETSPRHLETPKTSEMSITGGKRSRSRERCLSVRGSRAAPATTKEAQRRGRRAHIQVGVKVTKQGERPSVESHADTAATAAAEAAHNAAVDAKRAVVVTTASSFSLASSLTPRQGRQPSDNVGNSAVLHRAELAVQRALQTAAPVTSIEKNAKKLLQRMQRELGQRAPNLLPVHSKLQGVVERVLTSCEEKDEKLRQLVQLLCKQSGGARSSTAEL